MTVLTTNSKTVVDCPSTDDKYFFNFMITTTSQLRGIWSDGNGVTKTVKLINITAPNQDFYKGGSCETDKTLGKGTLTIYRKVPLTQELDLGYGEEIPSAPLEDGLDKLTMNEQDNNSDLSRAMLVPITDSTTDLELPSQHERAYKYLSFDEDGKPIASVLEPFLYRHNYKTNTVYYKEDFMRDEYNSDIYIAVKTFTSTNISDDLKKGNIEIFIKNYASNAKNIDGKPVNLTGMEDKDIIQMINGFLVPRTIEGGTVKSVNMVFPMVDADGNIVIDSDKIPEGTHNEYFTDENLAKADTFVALNLEVTSNDMDIAMLVASQEDIDGRVTTNTDDIDVNSTHITNNANEIITIKPKIEKNISDIETNGTNIGLNAVKIGKNTDALDTKVTEKEGSTQGHIPKFSLEPFSIEDGWDTGILNGDIPVVGGGNKLAVEIIPAVPINGKPRIFAVDKGATATECWEYLVAHWLDHGYDAPTGGEIAYFLMATETPTTPTSKYLIHEIWSFTAQGVWTDRANWVERDIEESDLGVLSWSGLTGVVIDPHLSDELDKSRSIKAIHATLDSDLLLINANTKKSTDNELYIGWSATPEGYTGLYKHVDNNDKSIVINAGKIETNETNISTNTGDIKGNSDKITTNIENISTINSSIGDMLNGTSKFNSIDINGTKIINVVDLSTTNKGDTLLSSKGTYAIYTLANDAKVASTTNTENIILCARKTDLVDFIKKGVDLEDYITDNTQVQSNKTAVATNKTAVATNKAGVATNTAKIADTYTKEESDARYATKGKMVVEDQCPPRWDSELVYLKWARCISSVDGNMYKALIENPQNEPSVSTDWEID